MKLTLKRWLEVAWIYVNLSALIAIVCLRLSAWQIWSLNDPLTPEQIQSLAASATRNRLAEMLSDADATVRSGVETVRITEAIWATTLVLNVALVVTYYLYTKPKPSGGNQR